MSLTRIAATLAVAATGLTGGAVLAAPASASAASCHVSLRAGIDSVRVRTYASTSAPSLGILYPGQTLPSACSDGPGGSYTDCGGSSVYWVTVYWGPNGDPASVAGKCVWITPN
jgi:hypothetical protein